MRKSGFVAQRTLAGLAAALVLALVAIVIGIYALSLKSEADKQATLAAPSMDMTFAAEEGGGET